VSHWFDRLSERTSGSEPVTRRDAIKTAAVAGAAVGALSSPAIASAGSALESLERESNCACQERAQRQYNNTFDSLGGSISPINTALFPHQTVAFVGIGLAGALFGLAVQKLSCGPCEKSPSGGKKPAPPSFTPCTPRGGLRRGPQCPGGGGETDCPSGTSRCTKDLCCFGTDVCCACTSGVATCCNQEIGCGCCA
jgi:hypothetical protein